MNRLTHMAALVAATHLICMGDAFAQGCDTDITYDPFPIRSIDAVRIQGGGGYSASGIVTPVAVRIALDVTDNDTLLVWCDGVCYPFETQSDWTADWTLGSGSNDPGAFLRSDASMVSVETDRTAVLFLPPRDMPIGGTTQTTINVDVRDLCELSADPLTLITIQSVVVRTGEDEYDVDVNLVSIADPLLFPPDCEGEAFCELVGPFFSNDPAPSVSIVDHPMNDMLLEETRPLHADAMDFDTVFFECGTPPGHFPVVSNFDQGLYCDDIVYTWAVVGGFGNGVFVEQGRTALFRGTQVGNVRVRVTADAGGEIATAEVEFWIFPARVESVAFKDSFEILRDKNNNAYDAPHWKDNNQDGDAADAGERRFPVAYKRDTKVTIDEVKIACPVRPMPGIVIEGQELGGHVYRGAWKEIVQGTPGPWYINSKPIECQQKLPDMVRKYESYFLAWGLSWDRINFAVVGSTDNWLYVTLDDPLGGPSYFKRETVFDISCRNADSAANETFAAGLVWADFADLVVTRKSRDGDNVDDGVLMKYWLPDGPTACSWVDDMLSAADGNGRCGAWAQLLRGCFAVQGISSTVSEVVPKPAGPANAMLINRWEAQIQYISVGMNGVNESTLAGDDVAVIAPGNGSPWRHAITNGVGANLASTPAGDDVAIGSNPGHINTGANGINDTAIAAGDVSVIPQGNGLPWVMGISPGVDGVINSVKGGDDVVVLPVPGVARIYQAPVPGDKALTLHSEFVNAPGIAGQANPEPPFGFFNHYVLEFTDAGGTAWILDPSYAAFAAGANRKLTHQNGAIAAFLVAGKAELNDAATLNLDYNPKPAL